MAFTLHPQLAKDTFDIGGLALCRVLLMNNRLFPWLVLVPRKPNLRELTDLSRDDRNLCMDEVTHASAALAKLTRADKMNIAALGNQVPQLHIHVIARFMQDVAWPQPVWGKGAEPYPQNQAQDLILTLANALQLR